MSDYPVGGPGPLDPRQVSDPLEPQLERDPLETQLEREPLEPQRLEPQQGGGLKDAAAESGRHVVGTAKDQASSVTDEAKTQAKDLMAQAREELRAQAHEQQQRVATGLHSVGEQFDRMAANAGTEGTAVDLVRQAADKSRSVADWIGQRDPGSVLGELRAFASRRPGLFIAAAATAGILVGRFTRATIDEKREEGGGGNV